MRAEEGSGDKTYDQYRPLLFSIAYRMLGSVMDAEDVTQEAFVRWRAPEGEVRSPKAYLSAVVTRPCIERLRSARERREEYVGPWLPEPLPDERVPDAAETLAPLKNRSRWPSWCCWRASRRSSAVFLLREVFDYDYSEVARIVGKEGAHSCKHPILDGYLIPLVHRLKGNETVRAELSARRDH